VLLLALFLWLITGFRCSLSSQVRYAYCFTHGMVQRACYDMLPYAQKVGFNIHDFIW
jgi:hypothetical protein